MRTAIGAWGLVLVLGLASCGGSGFESGEASDAGADASAGNGGTGGTGGAGGSAGASGQAGTGGTAGTGGVAGAAGAGSVCDTDCLQKPPPDWMGPVAAKHQGPSQLPPTCVAPYEAMAFTAFDKVEAEAAFCGCECQGNYKSTAVSLFGGTTCSGSPCAEFSAPEGQCITPPSSCSGVIGRLHATLPVNACVANPVVELPPFVRLNNTAVCNLPTGPNPTGCEPGQFCLTPGVDEVCIWKEGIQPCPPGPFGRQQIMHRTVKDTRECGDCLCTQQDGFVGTLQLFAGSSCGTNSAAVDVPTSCQTVPTVTGGMSFKYTPSDGAQGMCRLTKEPDPTGEVLMRDPVTLCCL